MPRTRAEGFFEWLKNLLNSGSSWQNVLVSQCNLLKNFGTITTKLKTAEKNILPFSQLYSIFCTTDIE